MTFKQIFQILSTTCLILVSSQGSQLQASNMMFAEKKVNLDKENLFKIFDYFFEEMQKNAPEFATFVGIKKDYNGIWTDHSEDGYFNRYVDAVFMMDRLHNIKKEALSPSELLNYDLLERGIKDYMEGYYFQMHYLSVDHLSGIPLEVESVLAMMPKTDEQAYEDILSRLSKIPVLIDQTIGLLDAGVASGITQPQIVIHKLPRSIIRMIPPTYDNSVFFQPFTSFPECIIPSKRKELVNKAYQIISEKVYPAYAKLYSYLLEEYIPACRETIAARDLPNGKDYYQYCIKRHTTTDLSPFTIHLIGCEEIYRILSEMELILKEIDFPGDLHDYFNYLNTSSEFFYSDQESLIQGYKDITNHIDSKLPLLFGRLPKLPYEIVPVPTFSQEGQIGAYYMPGSLDNGRPGRFFVNTFDLDSRPKWNMESLALHEAVPGHHFQISLAQEIQGLPQFRKYSNYTAYVEGWGLYSEGLGEELGLYQSPENRFGRLIEEIWRAARLMVDTGIHAFDWSREDAIDFMQNVTGMSKREATTEVDRYIVWPGQALAYKIGELSIKKWKNEAKEALGVSFDIREFHDMLLEKGALPLDICEKQVHFWVESKLSEKKQSA